ncbi:MAG: PRTRC system protein D [Sulfuritalea sp.]|nr:PRTRC system protein D [Sulfuritalea sp.]
MSKPIVRAIDVGYGSTKFTVLRQGPSEIHCGLFPSIAPQTASIPDLGGDLFQRRNTAVVEVNGVRYEVGKDAMLAKDASYGRTLDADYALTDAYMALLRGAIYYMGVDRIDVMVVGLPMGTLEAKRLELEKRLIGNHAIPSPRSKGDDAKDRIVHVEHVRVLAQPIGAFFDYSMQEGRFQKMRQEMNLVIDPGYFTLDWVVAQGVKIITARSGAHSGGMSAVLSTIGESIARDIGEQLPDYSSIDDALRCGNHPRFFGKEFDLSKYIPLAKDKARQFVAVLANKVGPAADIDNILIAGGGAEFFCDLVAEKFPKHNIQITPDPVFANVRGFQFAGELWANQNLKAPAAA